MRCHAASRVICWLSSACVTRKGTLLQVEATATAEGSTVARLGRSVEAAAAQRSPLEGAVARFAKYYTPVVLVAALLIAFVPWATSSESHKVLLARHAHNLFCGSRAPVQTLLLMVCMGIPLCGSIRPC